MIGRLKGTLVEVDPPHILVDVAGVGYEVEIPTSTLYELPPQGQSVTLFTHYVVREDAHLLFGFLARQERELFRLLIKVNSVGPKLALGILSGFNPAAFARCVEDNNVSALTKLPGVGRKTAERLLIEMKDRLKDWWTDSGDLPMVSRATEGMSGDRQVDEAMAALVALGYKPAEASRAINAVKADGLSAEEMIRLALKGMAKG